MSKISTVNSNRTVMVFMAAWLVMVAVLVASDSVLSQPTQAPPPATALTAQAPAPGGETLLMTRCSVCHSADRATRAKKTREQWEQTVTRMIGRGAELTEAEKTVLVDYLAKTYGP